jgi:hypothetical protein
VSRLSWFINRIRRKEESDIMDDKKFVGMEDEDPKHAAEEWENEQARKGRSKTGSESVPDEATGGGGGAGADPAVGGATDTPGEGQGVRGGSQGDAGGASQGGGSTGEGGGASQGGGTGNA